MDKIRTQAQEETPRGKILAAILAGCHTVEAIMKNACMGYDFRTFRMTIAELKEEGLLTYDKNQLWGEWGYYLSNKASVNL